MPNVYNETDFNYRVQFAASRISSGKPSTRRFDTCFEMHDGDAVVAALMRRVTAQPTTKLAKNIFQYLNETSVRAAAKRLASVKNLKQEAAQQRERAKREFDELMKNR